MRPDPTDWPTRLSDAMIAGFVASGAWRNRTIADRLDELVAKHPEQRLVIDDRGAYTAAALQDDALRLAGALAARGLRPGAVLSFQLPNWHEAVVIELACAYGGFVCNPIVPIYRSAEVGFIVEDAGTRVLFVPETFRNFDHRTMAEGLTAKVPGLEVIVVRPALKSESSFEALVAAAETRPAWPRPDPNHVKLLMYTSGTTSIPKGVLHTHNTIAAEIDNVIEWLELSAADVILMPSPLGHITGYLYGIELPVTLGCPVILMESWNPEQAAALIDANGVTLTIGATPFLRELACLAADRGSPLPSLRYFPTGGAPVPPDVILQADRAFARCVSFRIYGSTEAPTVTWGCVEPAQQALRATTEGFVLGHEMRLVDRAGVALAPGREGEITTRGPELFVGYKRAEHNEAAFDAEGYFRTGDLGIETPEGCLVVTGRQKDIIIRGGENISPKEIEDLICTHPDVVDAAVVAMPHPRLGETGCAFVLLRAGGRFDFEIMRGLLEKGGLARQKFPERLEVVDRLPYTAAGKVQKNLLRDVIGRRAAAEQGARASPPVA
ncbi:MAG TPA: AMP-binding protein [Stellaceae bacterium]|nr:AMP-binding protein [Stellaceae bacterium]